MTKKRAHTPVFRTSVLLASLLGGVLGVIIACNNSEITGGTGDDMSATSEDLAGTGMLNWDAGLVPLDGGIIVQVPDGGTRICYQATCQGKLYQCGNCMDDDGDGKIDADDPDCLGACDNSENGLSLAIPGANNAPCKQDCYFDQDTGSGNDNCYWDHSCDPTKVNGQPSPETSCAYNAGTNLGGGLTCTTAQQMQSKICKDFCGPLTPNGCDCFGCCAIGPQSDGSTKGIWLGSTDTAGNPSCTLNNLGDPAKCHPCQIVPTCFKSCGRCQLCIGKDTLPADCYQSGGGTTDGGTPVACPPGLCTYGQACGVSGCGPCKPGFYCITGCCVPTIG